MNLLERQRPSSTVCLVVPVFNEETRAAESFGPLFDYVRERGPGSRLVYVDDGSTDRTADVIVRAIRARRGGGLAQLRCRPHAGKGAAVRAGLLGARTDIAAFCDVDLATPMAELSRIIEEAENGSCLAVGSRAAGGARIEQHEERRRELAGKAFNRLVRLSLCPGIADTQCGAKAAPTAVWRNLLRHSKENGFAWDVEVIALALRSGVRVRELGVAWHHDERSTVRVCRDGLDMVASIPRMVRNVRKAPARALIPVEVTNTDEPEVYLAALP